MITKKDILEALGANTEDHFLSGMLLGIGVGAIVGSAVAILFAPRTGVEMRQLISEKGSSLVEKAKSRIASGKNGGEHAGVGGEPGAV
jgi:YtxH-like protein